MARTSTSRVAVAAGSQLAADAGAAVAADGGNAVDAAIAASLILMISEPGVCAPGAGGFVTTRMPAEEPVTIDANIAMPGMGADPARFGVSTRTVSMEYGGGVTTTVGYESVGTPGGIAGLGAAWSKWGSCPWRVVVEPAVDLARRGFPLSTASHLYLEYTHESIFGWHPTSHRAVHDGDRLRGVGELITVDGLADALARLGEAGAADAYTGELAAVMAADLEAGGSIVTADDLRSYAPTERASVVSRLGQWEVATNPPPSIGGATLSAMLQLATSRGDHPPTVDDLISAQERAVRYRSDHLDTAQHLEAATKELLDRLTDDGDALWRSSPSTVHASAVGADGAACAITMSAGYGSGVVAGDTGFWMNNSLGEVELNRRGFHGLPIGQRLPSNMAPTVAVRDDGAVVAIGSPGADRITTSIQQVLVQIASGVDAQDAVDAPRLHAEVDGEDTVVAYEPGLEIPETYASRRFEEPHMFFGGVAVAMLDPGEGLIGAADARRAGGVALS